MLCDMLTKHADAFVNLISRWRRSDRQCQYRQKVKFIMATDWLSGIIGHLKFFKRLRCGWRTGSFYILKLFLCNVYLKYTIDNLLIRGQ